MNKEHLETNLTLKASYKLGHIQIAPVFVHQEVECMHLHGRNKPEKQKYSQL